MNINNRWKAFVKLGDFILENKEELQNVIHKAYQYNTWFTDENTQKALQNIALQFLNEEKLEQWLSQYDLNKTHQQTIAVVAAGNIPMVAFHDILCILITGNTLMLKLSEKDKYLFPFLLEKLSGIEPGFKDQIIIKERLEKFNAIIATGSNNSAKHFEYYFGKYKHIIRKNRNSIGVLNGNETTDEIEKLGEDVFDYFGLGCRNVSKIFIPTGYDLMRLKEGLSKHIYVNQHTPYMNNLDYQRTLYLMNQTPFPDIDFINIIQHKGLHSPISTLYYEHYNSLDEVKNYISHEKENIQCIVGNADIENILPFGKSQQPGLSDYADNVDTMKFILND
ncbi:MAG: NAD-dependent aldehyde dehydrogenase [Bacteroidota bacterium]|nr:NAD-dependent aldehyde dehydrogenase [Bacteroidota bacterium]